ncbi:MAG: SPOR domain-containing protein [Pseudomonadota bacterium]
MAGKLPFKSVRFAGALSVTALLLAGCSGDGPLASLNLGLGQQDSADKETPTAATSKTTKTVERDVEAPEVFEVNDKALWDGRPSLGGVWVAHSDSKDPERVIIRNKANGKFVVGALFRREKELPGPSLQLSSDAAAALGVQAGTPTDLHVTALRREEVPVKEEAATPAPNPEGVETASLEDPNTAKIANAALASLDATDKQAVNATTTPAKPKAKTSSVSKPFVQIGFFSVENNAKSTVQKIKASGIPAKAVTSKTNGKTFWRVIAGPAASASEKRQLLNMVKKQGYTDAYFVKG